MSRIFDTGEILLRVDAIATLTPITPAIIAECVKAVRQKNYSCNPPQTRSMIVAIPCPPPIHTGDSDVEVAPFKLIECCPQQHRSCGTQRVAKCDGSTIHVHRAAWSNSSLRMTCRGMAAKASSISHRSISRAVMPASRNAFCEAGVGAVSMMIGSLPAVAMASIRARGLRPWVFTYSSDASRTAAAPSTIPLELPAV